MSGALGAGGVDFGRSDDGFVVGQQVAALVLDGAVGDSIQAWSVGVETRQK